MFSDEIEQAREHLLNLLREQHPEASCIIAITDGITVMTDFDVKDIDDVHLITSTLEKALEEQISRRDLIDSIDFEGGELGN